MRIQHRQIIPTGENSFVECLIHKGKPELRGYWKAVEISVSEFIKMYPRQANEMGLKNENG